MSMRSSHAALLGQQLGFEVTISVPEGDSLAFAAVARDGVEVMYQTHASMAKDIGAVGSMRSPVMLFCRVADLDVIIARLDETDIVVPRRRTPYGADEIYVRTVGGPLRHSRRRAATERPRLAADDC
jgi:hypothetical protein